MNINDLQLFISQGANRSQEFKFTLGELMQIQQR